MEEVFPFHLQSSGVKILHSKHINASLFPQNAHVPLAFISKQGGYRVGQKQLWHTQKDPEEVQIKSSTG